MKYERETLVAKLREYGIRYLAPSDAIATEIVPSEQSLLLALLEQADPRLQMALVPLFVRNPHLSAHIPALVDNLSPASVLNLKTYYMAAVYLQRLWHFRLGLYIDNKSLLPDFYSQDLELPPATERFGKPGLYDLADAWRNRSPFPFNWLASLNKTMDLFFEQLILENRPSDATAR